jgi:hypothetical protein
MCTRVICKVTLFSPCLGPAFYLLSPLSVVSVKQGIFLLNLSMKCWKTQHLMHKVDYQGENPKPTQLGFIHNWVISHNQLSMDDGAQVNEILAMNYFLLWMVWKRERERERWERIHPHLGFIHNWVISHNQLFNGWWCTSEWNIGNELLPSLDGLKERERDEKENYWPVKTDTVKPPWTADDGRQAGCSLGPVSR